MILKRFRVSSESSSYEESSEGEEYGAERDQFTAQLYKFHEERGLYFIFYKIKIKTYNKNFL